MTFSEYQKLAKKTAFVEEDYKGSLMEPTIWALGISGEAGEVVEKWKKLVAYRKGLITDDDKQEITKELGDVLWYISAFADSLGVSLEEVASTNISKQQDRQRRNVIKGSGDNR